MADSTTGGAAAIPPDYSVTHPLRPVALAGVLSLLLFAMSAALVYIEFTPLAPARRMLPLSIYALVLVATWTISLLTMVARQPRPDEAVRVWGPAASGIVYASHVACVWLIWQVLPYGTAELQLMVVVFLTAYVPTQIICSPENTLANRLGIITVLGSTIAFLALRGGQPDAFLAVYLAGFAVTMFWLSQVVHTTVRTTVAARLASDASARDLARLLAAVAEERDAKTRFIAAASHDLGQPLQAAGLFFDQVIRAQSDEQRRVAIDGVRKAFASAEQLLAHMLNHLRLEADAVEPQLSRVALGATFLRLARQFTPAAQQARMRIRVAPSNHVLLLDPALFDRALGNLLANAIQHSGGTQVLIGARRHGPSTIRIWVIDNGVGIGRTDAAHVFEDYFQGSDSRSTVRSGFGLGLSSVRRIAQLMGGTADLDPRWIRGAAFHMSFPDAGLPRRRTRSPRIDDDRRTYDAILPDL